MPLFSNQIEMAFQGRARQFAIPHAILKPGLVSEQVAAALRGKKTIIFEKERLHPEFQTAIEKKIGNAMADYRTGKIDAKFDAGLAALTLPTGIFPLTIWLAVRAIDRADKAGSKKSEAVDATRQVMPRVAAKALLHPNQQVAGTSGVAEQKLSEQELATAFNYLSSHYRRMGLDKRCNLVMTNRRFTKGGIVAEIFLKNKQ